MRIGFSAGPFDTGRNVCQSLEETFNITFMKILYFSTPSFADCDFPLVKALQKAGHDVTYLIKLAPYSLKSTLFNINEQIQENNIIPAIRYPELRIFENYMEMSKVYIANHTFKQESSLQSLKMTLKIVDFIKKGKFDIIHSDYIFGMWNVMLYKIFGKKMVLTVHDPFPHSGETSFRKMLNYKIAMHSVRWFVLLNKKQKEEFCSTYKIKPTQILISRLGVYDNIRYFNNSVTLSKSHNVLFFGRISPYKGIEYLCKAMMKVKVHIPDATLTIAGGGKLYFDIAPYQQHDWVNVINRYVGLEELADLLNDSAVTVCPYIDATQSGVIMTSYSLCKPVIATNVGGLSEMVEDGKTGLIIPPKDVDALADAIISLFKDRKKLDEMAASIMNDYFVGDKSWKVIADGYVTFYNQAITSNKRKF